MITAELSLRLAIYSLYFSLSHPSMSRICRRISYICVYVIALLHQPVLVLDNASRSEKLFSRA